MSPALITQAQKVFVLGHHRTPVQDFEFSTMRLVEIAVCALSPGINDPFTAMARRQTDRLALRRHADMIGAKIGTAFAETQDRCALEERYQAVVKILNAPK